MNGDLPVHRGIQAFVASAVEAFALRGPTYVMRCCPRERSEESTWLRTWFPEAVYVDVGPEMEADACLSLRDATARTALCLGSLQQVVEPMRLVEQAERLLMPGGAMLLCASGLPDEPWQATAYWHLTPIAVTRLLNGLEGTLVGSQGSDSLPHTVYGIGFKPPLPPSVWRGAACFLESFQGRLDQLARRVDWRSRLRQLATAWTCSRWQRERRRCYFRAQIAVQLSVEQASEKESLQDLLAPQQTGARLDLLQ